VLFVDLYTPHSVFLGGIDTSPNYNLVITPTVQTAERKSGCSAPLREVKLEGPPSDFSLDTACRAHTQHAIQQAHPELLDLVQDGSLVLYTRPEDYVERRTDGYRCASAVVHQQ
jgi:hypothetical protein